MADEVIITYWGKSRGQTAGSSQPIYGKALGGQVLDIGTLSAEIPDYVGGSKVEVVKVRSKGTGFWIIRGTASAAAVANTNGNDWLEPGDVVDFEYDPLNTYIDTAA